jgi:predicted small metal-binding protein
MKKSLGCVDLGIATCTFEARSEHNDEIKDAIFTHAMKYHPEVVSNLTEKEQQEMSMQMDQLIK